jgi:hypothetical protein
MDTFIVELYRLARIARVPVSAANADDALTQALPELARIATANGYKLAGLTVKVKRAYTSTVVKVQVLS